MKNRIASHGIPKTLASVLAPVLLLCLIVDPATAIGLSNLSNSAPPIYFHGQKTLIGQSLSEQEAVNMPMLGFHGFLESLSRHQTSRRDQDAEKTMDVGLKKYMPSWWTVKLVLGMCLVAAAWHSSVYPRHLLGTQTPIVNVTNPQAVEAHWNADHAKTETASLQAFRKELGGVLSTNMNSLEAATAIRKWTRDQQTGNWLENDDSSDDPYVLLKRMRAGIPGTCRRFGYVLAGAEEAAGLDARVDNLSKGLFDESENHTFAEVWIPELGKWVAMDAMTNVTFYVDGQPASLLELYDAGRTAPERIRLERNGSTTQPTLHVDSWFKSLFVHAFFAPTNGYFTGRRVSLFAKERVTLVHYVHLGGQAYPETEKRRFLWATAILFVLGGLVIAWAIFERFFPPQQVLWIIQQGYKSWRRDRSLLARSLRGFLIYEKYSA